MTRPFFSSTHYVNITPPNAQILQRLKDHQNFVLPLWVLLFILHELPKISSMGFHFYEVVTDPMAAINFHKECRRVYRFILSSEL